MSVPANPVALRRAAYTGEPAARAQAAVAAAASASPVPTPRSGDQAQLEAELLLALVAALEHGDLSAANWDPYRDALPLAWCSPLPDHLVVAVPPRLLTAFCYSVLPHLGSPGQAAHGVLGLRAAAHAHHVDLFRPGRRGLVRVVGVTGRQWRGSVNAVRTLTPPSASCVWERSPGEPDPAEHVLGTLREVSWNAYAWLLSGLLRRLRLLRAARFPGLEARPAGVAADGRADGRAGAEPSRNTGGHAAREMTFTVELRDESACRRFVDAVCDPEYGLPLTPLEGWQTRPGPRWERRTELVPSAPDLRGALVVWNYVRP